MSFDLFEKLVRAVHVLIFDVENRIDEMLPAERPEAVFPPHAGCNRAVVERGLGVEIKLRRPPCGRTVFEFHPIGMVLIAGPLGAGAGAVVGGILGAIRGWSVHKDHIPKYEAKVQTGHVLVLVHSSDPRLLAAAEKTLHATRPQQIRLHSAVDDADDPKVDDL